MSTEILVIPYPHSSHIFPATELANRLAARNQEIILFLPSTTATASSSSIALHPRVQLIQFPVPHAVRFDFAVSKTTILPILSSRFKGADASSARPLCAIVDEMMPWVLDACVELQIPVVSLFTSSACSTAIHHAASLIPSEELSSGRILSFPGLQDDMAISASYVKTHPGSQRRRGLTGMSNAIALLMNTCDALEQEFLDYLAREAGKPVWGVGPLLPVLFWDVVGSGSVYEDEVRSKGESNVSEKDVKEWLDTKPPASVIYVSFGTVVGPTDEELGDLAAGLELSNRAFIWTIKNDMRQHGPDGQPVQTEHGPSRFSPDDLARRTQGRGLVIKGWAPQLTILSHVATGAYVCHCGWNSTVEAIGFGVPVLTWPVRGDQLINAKLLTNRFKVGLTIRGAGGGGLVGRDDVVRGIEKLMADEGIKARANSVKSLLAGGFPKSSSDSLDAFVAFLGAN